MEMVPEESGLENELQKRKNGFCCNGWFVRHGRKEGVRGLRNGWEIQLRTSTATLLTRTRLLRSTRTKYNNRLA